MVEQNLDFRHNFAVGEKVWLPFDHTIATVVSITPTQVTTEHVVGTCTISHTFSCIEDHGVYGIPRTWGVEINILSTKQIMVLGSYG